MLSFDDIHRVCGVDRQGKGSGKGVVRGNRVLGGNSVATPADVKCRGGQWRDETEDDERGIPSQCVKRFRFVDRNGR